MMGIKKLPRIENYRGTSKPILDVLCRTILSNYSPGQELSVGETDLVQGHYQGQSPGAPKPHKSWFQSVVLLFLLWLSLYISSV